MNGLQPLTYATVANWMAITHEIVEPHEVEALLRIDRAILFPTDPNQNGRR